MTPASMDIVDRTSSEWGVSKWVCHMCGVVVMAHLKRCDNCNHERCSRCRPFP